MNKYLCLARRTFSIIKLTKILHFFSCKGKFKITKEWASKIRDIASVVNLTVRNWWRKIRNWKPALFAKLLNIVVYNANVMTGVTITRFCALRVSRISMTWEKKPKKSLMKKDMMLTEVLCRYISSWLMFKANKFWRLYCSTPFDLVFDHWTVRFIN